MASHPGPAAPAGQNQGGNAVSVTPDVASWTWSSTNRRYDTLSCHSLAVTCLIFSYRRHKMNGDDSYYHPGKSCMDLGECIVELIQTPQGVMEPTFMQLRERLSQFAHDTLADELHDDLQSLSSVDALYNLYYDNHESFGNGLWDRGGVSPTSVVGIFWRSQQLVVRTGPFSALAELAQGIPEYLLSRPSRQLSSKLNIEHYLHDAAKRVSFGQGDIDEADLQRLADLGVTSPKAEYIRYLGHLRQRDFTLAVDALHKYFDLPLIDANLHGAPAESSDHSFARYGSLNLVAVHFRFGQVNAALAAVNQVIRIAQQYADQATLAHALAWLFRIIAVDEAPGSFDSIGVTTRLMRRCAARAEQLGLYHIASLSQLALARQSLQDQGQQGNKGSGEGSASGTPSIWTRMARATELSQASAHAPGSAGAAGATPATPGAAGAGGNAAGQVTSSAAARGLDEDAVSSLQRASGLLRGAAWDVLGSPGLASLAATQISRELQSGGDRDEIAFATCRLAIALVEGGDFAGASRVLTDARDGLGQPRHPVWYRTVLQLEAQVALNGYHLEQALVYVQRLIALSPRGSDISSHTAALYQYLQLLTKSRDYDRAARVGLTLRASALAQGCLYEVGAYNLALAEIHLAAGSPTSALPFALDAVASSSKSSQQRQLHASKLVLVRIQEQLGNAEEALAQVRAVMPDILATGPLDLRARCSLVYGRVQLRLIPSRPTDASTDDLVTSWHGKMTECLHELERARDTFRHVGNLEGLIEASYLLARVYRELGRTEASDLAAEEYIASGQARDVNKSRVVQIAGKYCDGRVDLMPATARRAAPVK